MNLDDYKSRHIARPLVEVLLFRAQNTEQLNIALSTIDAIAQKQVVTCPPSESPAELQPACRRFYDRVSKVGTADQVLKLAKISSYFREHHPRAISWAQQKQKNHIPQDSAVT